MLLRQKTTTGVGEAMQQIEDRDYAGRYALDPRTVYLIGANLNENKDVRTLSYEIWEA